MTHQIYCDGEDYGEYEEEMMSRDDSIIYLGTVGKSRALVLEEEII